MEKRKEKLSDSFIDSIHWFDSIAMLSTDERAREEGQKANEWVSEWMNEWVISSTVLIIWIDWCDAWTIPIIPIHVVYCTG